MALNFLIKPNIDTKFTIDYSWWENSREDLHIYLLTHLSPEQQQALKERNLHEVLDYVHPETGEVSRLDPLDVAIRESAQREGFINEHIGLIDNVFRALLLHGNKPLSVRDLAAITGRNPNTILKTIGGSHVYRGIRPYRQPSP